MRTGYFVRVLRDNKWQDLDITECTDEELLAYTNSLKDIEYAKSWIRELAKWIRDH